MTTLRAQTLAKREAEATMKTYRLIAVDFDGPLLVEPQTITAVSDDDAVAKARELVQKHDVEVWDGERPRITKATKALSIE